MSPRFVFALKASAWHLGASALVATCAAMLVFIFWYPFPYHHLAGGRDLFLLLMSVDVVCGPLLTLVLFSPTKPRGELGRDLALIVLIQLAAMLYGLNTLAQARPLALVYEVDRFRAVSMADLDESDLASAPDWLSPWSLSAPRLIGVRASQGRDELMKSVELGLAGIQTSQRPSRWQDYALNRPQVLARARPLSNLRARHPAQLAVLDSAIVQALSDVQPGESADPEALRWLPLVSRRAMDWVVLLDPVTARVRGYAHLDGF